jgi:ATP-dependent Clp protease ATP-binding subunit ClpB
LRWTKRKSEKDALERRFQPIFVAEPSAEDTISILRGLKERYEVHHGVRIQDSAVIAAATLSHRYISDRQLPDKVIDLIDEPPPGCARSIAAARTRWTARSCSWRSAGGLKKERRLRAFRTVQKELADLREPPLNGCPRHREGHFDLRSTRSIERLSS